MSNIYIADWSQKQVHVLDAINLAPIECRIGNLDVRIPMKYPSLLAAIEALPIGSTLLLERNWESYIEKNHDEAEGRAAEKQITIGTVNPRTTGNRRRLKFGIDLEALTRNRLLKDMSKELRKKIDHNVIDVNVLLQMYQSGTHFSPLQDHKPKQIENTGKINYKLMIWRATGERDNYIAEISNQLPNPNDDEFPDYLRKSLCKNKETQTDPWVWHPNVFATVVGIVKTDRGRKRLDFYTGHYGGNHPSMAASELKHHGWPNAQKNEATKQQYRQGIRWLAKTLKKVINESY